MKKTFANAKKFIYKHRVAIAFGAGLTVAFAAAYALSRGAVGQWNDFLESHGLTDEYYTIIDN